MQDNRVHDLHRPSLVRVLQHPPRPPTLRIQVVAAAAWEAAEDTPPEVAEAVAVVAGATNRINAY